MQGIPFCLLARRTSSRVRIRSYTSDIRGIPRERKRPGPKGHIISTLVPELLKSEDFLDPSKKQSISIRFPASDGRGAMLRYMRTEKDGILPFPPHSQGFLYCHSEPPMTLLEVSLRFRVTAGNNPSSFPRGQDLLTPWGLPWQITLPQIIHPQYAMIRDQLRHENLVTEGQLLYCEAVFQEEELEPHYTLFRLQSTFLVQFQVEIRLTAVSNEFHPVTLDPFRDWESGTGRCPWVGAALARLEPSTRAEHAGRRVLHLRIVKIIQPVTCTVEEYKGRVLKPEEGQLLNVSFCDGVPEPWAFDIDASIDIEGSIQDGAGLRVLWDASIGQGTLT
ncbi:hypothetical protein C8R44DRAFT_800428 [Mycena epipterygia]|nr:hypothetical protein C8R44DRAFT_800428 [Mycena epipterygia]